MVAIVGNAPTSSGFQAGANLSQLNSHKWSWTRVPPPLSFAYQANAFAVKPLQVEMVRDERAARSSDGCKPTVLLLN